MRHRFALAIAFSLILATPAWPAALQPAEQKLDAQSIIQRSVGANARDWEASPHYDCFEVDYQPNGGTRTYKDLMILGSPYQRLVKINGEPVSSQQQAQEQQKLEAAIHLRKQESPQQRSQRIAQYEQDRQRYHLLMDQMAKAFNFTLVGEQTLDNRQVYVLAATPKPGYNPPNMKAEVLTGMNGKMWIDTKTFQWVKVEAQVIRPVSIEGFLAKVNPGTQFELEKMPVTEDIWLMKHFSMKAKATVLFFFSHNSQEEESYYGYSPVPPTQAGDNGE